MKSTGHIIIQSPKQSDRLNHYQQPYRPELTPSSDAQTPDSNPFYENFFPPDRNPFDPRYRPLKLNPSSGKQLEPKRVEQPGGLWQRIKGSLFSLLNLFNNIRIFGA